MSQSGPDMGAKGTKKGAGAREIRLRLGELSLPGRHSAMLGAALPVTHAAYRHEKWGCLRTLRRIGWPRESIEELCSRLAEHNAAHLLEAAWPTAGEDRKVLDAAVTLSFALAEVLSRAGPRAALQFDVAGERALHGWHEVGRLVSELHGFAHACADQREKMPRQTRSKARSVIAESVHEIGGRVEVFVPSLTKTKPFYRAVKAAFCLAGLTFMSPGRPTPDHERH